MTERDDLTPLPAPHPSTPPKAATPHKPSYVGRLIVLLSVGALGFLIYGKVKIALEKQVANEKTRTSIAAEASAKANAPPSVGVVKPIRDSWTPMAAAEGTLLPVRETDLAFKPSGVLSVLKVKAGDFIEKDALLAELDATEARAQAAAAAAQVRTARAQWMLAIDNSKRMKTLAESGATTSVTADEATGRTEMAQGQLDAAVAQVALASANLKNHRLLAPFSGFVTRTPTTIGGYVAPGSPIFHLQDVSSLKLVGTVGELDRMLVVAGAEVLFDLGGRPVSGTKVTMLLPSVDAATRRIPFEAELKNDGKDRILGGTFVRGQVKGAAPIDVLRVPATTLRPGSQDELMVVKSGKLSPRRVLYVTAKDGSLLIRSGLNSDDDVMLTPTAEAKEGDLVTVLPSEGKSLSIEKKSKEEAEKPAKD